MDAVGGADEDEVVVSGFGIVLRVGIAGRSLGPILTSVATDLSKSPPVRFSMLRFLSLSENPISRSWPSFSCSSYSGTSLVTPDVGLYSTGVILKASFTPALSFLDDVRKLKPKNLCFFPGAGNSAPSGG